MTYAAASAPSSRSGSWFYEYSPLSAWDCVLPVHVSPHSPFSYFLAQPAFWFWFLLLSLGFAVTFYPPVPLPSYARRPLTFTLRPPLSLAGFGSANRPAPCENLPSIVQASGRTNPVPLSRFELVLGFWLLAFAGHDSWSLWPLFLASGAFRFHCGIWGNERDQKDK